jgi:hypothetical protein
MKAFQISILWASSISLFLISTAMAQTSNEIRGLAPVIAIKDEPPPKLVVDGLLARQVVDVQGASHVVRVSHPDAVAAWITKAAESVTPSTAKKQ